MPGRKPDKFKLKPTDKIFLHQLLRDGQTPLRVARRAQILLGRADDQLEVGALGKMTDQHRSTVWRICECYQQHGLEAALYDAPRSGRPRVFFQKRTPGD